MFDRYVIKKGETLDNIAEFYNTNKELIKDINDIYYDDLIRAGMEIIVPKKSESYFNHYPIKKGDSLTSIGQKFNVNPELLASMNGLDINDYIYEGQEILVPKAGYSYYICDEGDTLKTVCQRFQSNIEKLLNDNETIYLLPGQILVSKRQT